jgi:sialate O-acetylesterase
MGRIDDFDEVYLNGEMVGATGSMIDFPTWEDLGEIYLIQRNYYLKFGLVKPGKNTVAVRVFDGFKDGGIYKGPVGLITQSKFTKYWKDKD